MKTIEQRRKEWLDSHLAPYLADPSQRAMFAGTCCYRTKEGKKCIVGQDIPDKKYVERMDSLSNSAIHLNDFVLNALPKRTKDLGIDFLREAQRLHDGNANWNDEGLTTDGKEAYDNIMFVYCN